MSDTDQGSQLGIGPQQGQAQRPMPSPMTNLLSMLKPNAPPPPTQPFLPAQTMNPDVAKRFPEYVPQYDPRSAGDWGTPDPYMAKWGSYPGVDPNPQMPQLNNIPHIMQSVGSSMGRFGSFRVGMASAGMMNNYAAYVTNYVKGLQIASQLAHQRWQDSMENLIMTQRTELLHAGEIFSTYKDPQARRAALEQLARSNQDSYLLNALAQGEDQAEKVLQWRDDWLRTMEKTSAQSKKATEQADLGDFGSGGGTGGSPGTIGGLLAQGQAQGGTAAGQQIGPNGQFVPQQGQGGPASVMGAGRAAGQAPDASAQPDGTAGVTGSPAGSAGQGPQQNAPGVSGGPQAASARGAGGGWSAQPIRGQPGVPIDPTGTHPVLSDPVSGESNLNTPIMDRARQAGVTPNGLGTIDSVADNVQMDPSTNINNYPGGVKRLITERAGEKDQQLNAILRGNLRGQDALNAIANVNPTLAKNLYRYIEGLEMPPSAWAEGKAPWRQISALALKIDPSFNSNVWATRAKTITDFTTGTEGRNLTRLGQVYDHMKHFLRELKDRPTRGTGWLGTYLGIGNVSQTSLKADWEVVASEIAGVLHGSGTAPVTTTEDFNRMVNLDTMSSPAIALVVQRIGDRYIKARAEELHDQFASGVGWPAEQTESRFQSILKRKLGPTEQRGLGLNDTADLFNEATGRKGPISGQGSYSGWTATPVP